MSTMAATEKPRRPRRQFTEEFKAGAVGLVLDERKSVAQVVRELDLTESALRTWVEHARADRTKGRTGLTSEEREELRRLRKENRTLRTEREILKEPRPSSPRTTCEVRVHPGGEGLLSAAQRRSRVLRFAWIRRHVCSRCIRLGPWVVYAGTAGCGARVAFVDLYFLSEDRHRHHAQALPPTDVALCRVRFTATMSPDRYSTDDIMNRFLLGVGSRSSRHRGSTTCCSDTIPRYSAVKNCPKRGWSLRQCSAACAAHQQQHGKHDRGCQR